MKTDKNKANAAGRGAKCTVTDRTVDPDVLTYTVGEDPVLDLELAKWDCMGTAAHVTMLSEMKGLRRPVVTKAEATKPGRAISVPAAKIAPNASKSFLFMFTFPFSAFAVT